MGESPIQKTLRYACARAGIVFDKEEQVGRYRVDLFDESRMIVVEVDGHDWHKTAEQRTSDASRDRYLLREGYQVVRFTGTEILKDVGACVEEIRQIIAVRTPLERAHGAIYIDWLFFDRACARRFRGYKNRYPDKALSIFPLSGFLSFLARYLGLEGRYDVHLFGAPSAFSTSIVPLDTHKLHRVKSVQYAVTEHQTNGVDSFVALSLMEHLYSAGTSYENLIMIAADGAYPPLFDRGRTVDVLITDPNQRCMDSVHRKTWQSIDYIVGYCLGLETHEL